MILSAPVRGARAANQGLTSAASWLLALAPSVHYTWLPQKDAGQRRAGLQVRAWLLFALFTNLLSGEGCEGCRIPCLRSGGSGCFSPLGLLTQQRESAEVGNIRNRAAVRVSWRPYHAAPSSRLYKATGASSAPGARGRADGALLHQFLGSSHLLRVTGCLCPACFREATVEFGRTAP